MRTIPLLTLAVICAIVFNAGAGLLVYRDTQLLIHSRSQVEHIHEVIESLQQSSQRLDRIESHAHLFQLAHDNADRLAAQAEADMFQAEVLRLQTTAQESPEQTSLVRELDGAVEQLRVALDSAPRSNAPVAAPQIQNCRRLIGAIKQRERALRARFDEDAKRNPLLSFTGGTLLIGLSRVGVIVMFAFLFRDALHRRRVEKQVLSLNQQLAASVRGLEERAEHARVLTVARDELHLCVTAADAHDSVARTVAQLLPGSRGALCVVNNSRQMVEAAAAWGDGSSLPEMFRLDACCGLRSGHLRWRIPGKSEIHCAHFSGAMPDRYLCLPLAAHGGTLAVLYVECPTAEIASVVDQRLDTLIEFVELAAVSIAGLNLRSKLESQSIRDSLTSLFNRHFMEVALDRELKRAERHGTNLAVFMLDVDHFKQFNDVYGHEAGDTVLREVADVFRRCVRSEDIVCRYGGEKFVIILPEITPEMAFERAEKIRVEVGAVRVRLRGEVLREVTISIGIAMYPQSGDFLDQILRVADRSLYEAKHRGRNQTVFAEPLGIA